MYRALRKFGCAALLALHAAHADTSAPRVVSINLCTDQLLLQLADRAQIASVTWMARDAALSQFAPQAANFPINHGLLEEILPLRPDLVLAGKHSAPQSLALLRRFHLRVMELEMPRSFDEVARQTLDVATVLRQRERGEAAVRRMRARLAAVAPPAQPQRVAVLYQPNGFAAASGSFADEILQRAGLDNLTRRLGWSAERAYLPLETLIHAAPDVLVLEQRSRPGAALATALFDHPAMRRFAAARRLIELPPGLTMCATTESVAAVEALAPVRLTVLPR